MRRGPRVACLGLQERAAAGGRVPLPPHLGQARLVQEASRFRPLDVHMQVFTPSPSGYAMPGAHCPSGHSGAGSGPQEILLQEASDRRPLRGHAQVLQPSPAGKSTPGQQRCCAAGSGAGVLEAGAEAQKSLVQLASLFTPLQGQVHVFRPSPAG